MSSLADKASIVGIGATDFSKDSGRSELRLAAEAVQAAVADAEGAGAWEKAVIATVAMMARMVLAV